MNNVYDWQYNTIPGNAKQGSVLMTRNNILQPPFNQTDFIWLAMEDIIGTADIKLEYDEVENLYKIYKAKGHRDNEGNWSYDWEFVGDWAALTEEVVEVLRSLNYVEYIYDTSVENRLKVIGVDKDGTRVELCNISFTSKQEFDTAVETLSNNLNNEITRATNKETEIQNNLNTEITRAIGRENELEDLINTNKVLGGNASEIVENDGRIVNVKVDNDNIKINNSNQLTATVFDDTQVSSNKGWTSAKITQQLTSAMTYEGQVANVSDLPTNLGTSDKGKTYNVQSTGDNYTWNGTSWDNLSGEYIAGQGIEIEGKVIKATGIAFDVGDGLIQEGVGDEAVLKANLDQGLEFHSGKIRTKIGQGIQFDARSGLKVKANIVGGIEVDDNGIGVKCQLPLYPDIDGIGIDYNSTNLKVENNKLDTVLQTWTGTQAQYDALGTYDSNTLYLVQEA